MALGVFSSKPVKPEDVSPFKMKVYLVVAVAVIVCAIGLKIFDRHGTNNSNNNILHNITAQNLNVNTISQNSNAALNTNGLLDNANQNINASFLNTNTY